MLLLWLMHNNIANHRELTKACGSKTSDQTIFKEPWLRLGLRSQSNQLQLYGLLQASVERSEWPELALRYRSWLHD